MARPVAGESSTRARPSRLFRYTTESEFSSAITPPNMTEEIQKTSPPFTHTAYLFVRTGMRKGRVYGYWKDGGRVRLGREDARRECVELVAGRECGSAH